MANWFLPILLSSLMLGLYDVSKKHAVRDNSVMPVLMFSTWFGTLLFLALAAANGQLLPALHCSSRDFLLVLLKSFLVASSWICGYYAVRELPLSLASPIRSSAPLWTLLGGIVLFHEIPDLRQRAGILTILVGYALFSVFGKQEGFSWKSRGMLLIIGCTLLGAGSALYDKCLLHVFHVPRMTLQLYFMIDLAVVLTGAWGLRRGFFSRGPHAFRWRWSIPATGFLLLLADYCYFYALSVPDAAISVLSLIRRCNCIVAFLIGIFCFKEIHWKRKTVALVLLLLGILLLAR